MIDNLMDDLEYKIMKELPHGSGIDYSYFCMGSCVENNKTGGRTILFKFGNSFRYMNDNGFYDGRYNFSVTLRLNNMSNTIEVVDVRVPDRSKRARMINEYLDDLFYMSWQCEVRIEVTVEPR